MEKFGEWTKLRNADPKDGKARIWVQCSCGKVAERDRYSVTSGKSKSCGHDSIRKMTESKLKHGHSRRNKVSKTYRSYRAMMSRCYYKNGGSFERYGAVGVKVCQRWRDSYENFLEDMGEKPKANSQIDRIDGSKGYEPSNCRWVSPSENSINRKTTVFCEFKGVRLPFTQLMKHFKISVPAVNLRMRNGMSRDEAIADAYYSPQRGKMSKNLKR